MFNLFRIVERIVRLVAFDNMACFDIVADVDGALCSVLTDAVDRRRPSGNLTVLDFLNPVDCHS